MREIRNPAAAFGFPAAAHTHPPGNVAASRPKRPMEVSDEILVPCSRTRYHVPR